MSDGTAFAIDMLGWQLHRQHMDQMRSANGSYAALSAQHGRLIADYNQLADRFDALQKTAREQQRQADARIAQLEERAGDAESSAEHWRNKYWSLFKRTLPP